ncbi:hypothetical protein MA3A0930S_2758 [Mycobacteroides abscessus 3A-0930-S]|nr:hypothetical protein MA3A0122R_2792 [Mycobacteroides abscessus 3A-0122-R]EIV53524.1 hypothetical protein MA3A0930S_2758 [Mycobacteroides abscessus 3A-0930-S]EIV77983.1 hypothetical protein MM3A0810R_2825 [Mycobacteroides abscessus 3A-0810-R]ETZ61133.1 hypothetical protein L836_2558 [Mycobacteroides abscessus MAB_110811_2726]EUA84509.1 hypothetical protein I541_1300 [Mycobacteroides abscessus]
MGESDAAPDVCSFPGSRAEIPLRSASSPISMHLFEAIA